MWRMLPACAGWRSIQGGALDDQPLVLWYEDVLADPGAATGAVAAYLGIALDPAAAVEVPVIERQSQAGARAWAERHAGG